MNTMSLPSCLLADVCGVCPQTGLLTEPAILNLPPEQATSGQFEAIHRLHAHLLPGDQIRIGERLMSRDEVLKMPFTESDVLALLEDSICGFDRLDQALVNMNASLSLKRGEHPVDQSNILPVILSLANQSEERIPNPLDLVVAFARKTQTVPEPITEWRMIAPFCKAVIQTGVLPENTDYLCQSQSKLTQMALSCSLDRLANTKRRMVEAESREDEGQFMELAGTIQEISEEIEHLFYIEEFKDVNPNDFPGLVDNLGVSLCPTLDIMRHSSAVLVELDKLLVAAIRRSDHRVLLHLSLPILRPDGAVDTFELQVAPDILHSQEQPLNVWLDTYMRLRGVVDCLRKHAVATRLDTAARKEYDAVLRSLNIPVFGSDPEQPQATVTRLMGMSDGNSELQDSLLNVLCTPTPAGRNGETTSAPIADYPSNLPFLIWMMPLLMSRDDLDTRALARAMQGCDSELLPLLNFCKECTRSGKYAALAGRLTSEIDKALGAGVRETRKAALVLVLDWLITINEVRRTLKNLIPRVGDLRKMVAGISSLTSTSPIQPALDRVTLGLTPNLEDYFGQEALKARVLRMISGFLHMAEDTTRLRGRKPCEVVKNGLLLPGPPGGGKTFFMDCLMNTLGLQCFFVSPEKTAAPGSAADRLMTQGSLVDLLDKKIAEAEAYVRKHNKPCILKLDEFEQFCLDRRQFKDHFEQTNHALTLIERLRANPRIFLLAATNHLDFVDEAMRRVGRFDVVRAIGLPDSEAARRIIAGTVFPYPEISLTSDQYGELADIAAKGQLIPLSIIQTLTAGLMVTGKAPAFEELKTAMLETVEDRRISSGWGEPMAA